VWELSTSKKSARSPVREVVKTDRSTADNRGVRTKCVDMVYRASGSDIHKLLEVVGQLPASCKLGGRIERSRAGEEGEKGVA
jgi:hypothetical protein